MTGPVAPTLVGDTVDASINFTASSGYGVGRVSGFGLDHPFVVIDGVSDLQRYANVFTLNVDGNSFAIKFLETAQWTNGVEFKLTGLDFSSGAALISVGASSNLSGYSLTHTAHEIDIDLSHVAFNADSYLTGTFNVGSVSPVPEPSSFAMAALGLAALGAVARRRSAIQR